MLSEVAAPEKAAEAAVELARLQQEVMADHRRRSPPLVGLRLSWVASWPARGRQS